MNSLYSEAGQRIRRLREINGYTREELAEIADISSKFLYEIETGHKGFSADTLYRIAKALSVNSDFILTGINSSKHIDELISTLSRFDDMQIHIMIHLLELYYEINKKC
jgi:transcriptional regulator with XRE-family HTH domain